jgi:hypothetical protein
MLCLCLATTNKTRHSGRYRSVPRCSRCSHSRHPSWSGHAATVRGTTTFKAVSRSVKRRSLTGLTAQRPPSESDLPPIQHCYVCGERSVRRARSNSARRARCAVTGFRSLSRARVSLSLRGIVLGPSGRHRQCRHCRFFSTANETRYCAIGATASAATQGPRRRVAAASPPVRPHCRDGIPLRR